MQDTKPCNAPAPTAAKTTGVRAYTLLELMVVVGVIGIIAGALTVAWGKLLPQTQLRNSSNEASVMLQKARLTAIQQNKPVTITVDWETEDWAKSANNNPTGISRQWLVASVEDDETGAMVVVDRVIVSKPHGGVFLRGPNDLVGGADAVTFTGDTLVINADGSIPETGSFRFSDTKSDPSAPRNVLEVYLGTLGGRATIRKYLEPEDRPAGVGAQDFFESTLSGGKEGGNVWVWY
ncbi:MAG: GspH/FimT family pseudopilin [Acidobacteriota bacterium]